MRTLFLVGSLLIAFLADIQVAWKPWVTELSLKHALTRSADGLTRYFRGATSSDWQEVVQGLTPRAKVQLSVFGRELRMDGQAEIAKAIRVHQQLFRGVSLRSTNAVVESEAGRLATVLVQAIIGSESLGISEPVMLRLGLIKIDGRWLIHHIRTVEGYMSLI